MKVPIEDVKRQHAEERLLIGKTEAAIKRNEEKSKDGLLWGVGGVILCGLVAAATSGSVWVFPLNDGAVAVTGVMF